MYPHPLIYTPAWVFTGVLQDSNCFLYSPDLLVYTLQTLLTKLPPQKGDAMKKGEKLVIIGCSGAGGPAAMMAKKLMPEIDVTIIRKEEFFIVR